VAGRRAAGGLPRLQPRALRLRRRAGRRARPGVAAARRAEFFGWREYGNRVGAWRCLELFDSLGLPAGAIVNTALYDHCPELVQAHVARGDELVGHGHTNAERQGGWSEAAERELLAACRDRIARESGRAPAGWLSPWISESALTPDLLAETGYGYTLNWCHDDQPVPMRTRTGTTLWSVPYPQELNDIPMMMARQMDTPDFFALVQDNFEEMLQQSRAQPLVMGLALHPYIVGQPHRLQAPARRAGSFRARARRRPHLVHHAGRHRGAHAGDLDLRAQLHHRVVRQVQEVGRGAGVVVHLREQLLAPLRHAAADGGHHHVARQEVAGGHGLELAAAVAHRAPARAARRGRS
jgi:hypothetical protein